METSYKNFKVTYSTLEKFILIQRLLKREYVAEIVLEVGNEHELTMINEVI